MRKNEKDKRYRKACDNESEERVAYIIIAQKIDGENIREIQTTMRTMTDPHKELTPPLIQNLKAMCL